MRASSETQRYFMDKYNVMWIKFFVLNLNRFRSLHSLKEEKPRVPDRNLLSQGWPSWRLSEPLPRSPPGYKFGPLLPLCCLTVQIFWALKWKNMLILFSSFNENHLSYMCQKANLSSSLVLTTCQKTSKSQTGQKSCIHPFFILSVLRTDLSSL